MYNRKKVGVVYFLFFLSDEVIIIVDVARGTVLRISDGFAVDASHCDRGVCYRSLRTSDLEVSNCTMLFFARILAGVGVRTAEFYDIIMTT